MVVFNEGMVEMISVLRGGFQVTEILIKLRECTIDSCSVNFQGDVVASHDSLWVFEKSCLYSLLNSSVSVLLGFTVSTGCGR